MCICWYISGHTHFGLLNNICKFSNPDEAIMRCDQKEAVTTVQGGSSGLNQSGLDMPSTWLKCTEKLGHYQCESYAEPPDVRCKHTKWFAWTAQLYLGWILNSEDTQVMIYYYEMLYFTFIKCALKTVKINKLPSKQNITAVGHNMLLMNCSCVVLFIKPIWFLSLKDRMLFWEHAHRFRLRGMPYEEQLSP